jgi:hypothetical protein
MRGFLIFLFVITVPIVIFLTTILYGGFTVSTVKQDLVKADVYTKISGYLQTVQTDETDPNLQQFDTILKTRLNASYVQGKTENVLDSSSSWISGQTTTPPVLSFKEVKDDIVAQNPNLLPNLTSLQKEIQNQSTDQSANPDEANQQQAMSEAFNSFNTMLKSDFTIQLGTYLQGVKQFYTTIKIAQPVLGILLLVYLLLIFFLSTSAKSKFLWLGWTFLLTGIWGFVVLLLTKFITSLISHLLFSNTTYMMQLVTPILTEIINRFTSTYVSYQGICSVVFFLVAAGCFIAASLHTSPIQTPTAKTPKSQSSKKK